jgi:hypothetical protein
MRAFALGLALSATVFAADYKDVNRTVALSASGAIAIETHKGSIRVSTWDQPTVEIQARIEAEPGTSMDFRRFEGTEVVIDSSPDSVHIRTKYPDFNWCCSFDSGSNPEVRYTIRMPRTARLAIRDHRSETEISDMQGALDLETHSGTAHVRGLGGPLRVDTHRGNIQVEFASFTGNSSVTTHRGTIELSMPTSARFDLETDLGRHASIHSDFPMVTRTANRGEKLHGSVNGGGPSLRVDAYRGEIRIRAK